jgi:MFS family permease
MSTRITEGSQHRWLLLGVLLTAPFMAQADVTIVNVATPSIHADLGASGAALQLVVGGYLIALAMLLITGARLGQAFGYRRVFVAGVSLFTLASLACGLAVDPVVLIVARVLQGAAAGVMFPQTLTGIQLHFSGAERVRAISRYALALSAGAVSGQVLGGLLVSADLAGLGWRPVFLINVPVGVAAVAGAVRFLPADGRGQSRLDLAGVALLSVTVLLIVVPLTLGNSAGWPAWAWASLAASLPAAAVFVAAERLVAGRGGTPLLDVRLLAIPVIRWSLIALTTATATYYVLLFTVAQYLQGGLGRSPAQSGLMLVPWVAAFGLAGQLVRRLPASRWLPAAGCLLLAAAYAAISSVLFAGERGDAMLAPLFAVGGLGLGINFAVLTGRMTGAVSARHAPDISGVSATLTSIGGSIGVAALGSLYLALARTAAPAARHAATAAHAFAVTAGVLAGLGLFAALAAYRASWPAAVQTAEPQPQAPAAAGVSCSHALDLCRSRPSAPTPYRRLSGAPRSGQGTCTEFGRDKAVRRRGFLPRKAVHVVAAGRPGLTRPQSAPAVAPHRRRRVAAASSAGCCRGGDDEEGGGEAGVAAGLCEDEGEYG